MPVLTFINVLMMNKQVLREEMEASPAQESASALSLLECVYRGRVCSDSMTFMEGLYTLLQKDRYYQVEVSDALARLVDMMSSKDLCGTDPHMAAHIGNINKALDFAVEKRVSQGGAFYDCHFLPGGSAFTPPHFYAKRCDGSDIVVQRLIPRLKRAKTTEKWRKDANRLADVIAHFKAHNVDLATVTKKHIHSLFKVSKATKLALIKSLPAPPAPAINEPVQPARSSTESSSASPSSASVAAGTDGKRKRSMEAEAIKKRVRLNTAKLETCEEKEVEALKEELKVDLAYQRKVRLERPVGQRSVQTIQRNMQRAKGCASKLSQLKQELMIAKEFERTREDDLLPEAVTNSS